MFNHNRSRLVFVISIFYLLITFAFFYAIPLQTISSQQRILLNRDSEGSLAAFATSSDDTLNTSMQLTNVAYLPIITNSASTSTPTATSTSTIVFASDRDGNYEIYRMNGDGTEQTRLTDNTSGDYSPELSPDGSKIVFASSRTNLEEIYMMNIDGSEMIALTNDSRFNSFSPSWSADGAQIAFGRMNVRVPGFAPRDIFTMNSDGSNITQITFDGNANVSPSWSPDSNKIVYNRVLGIYVINADGTGRTRLSTPAGWDDFAPDWSPDGERIVFVSSRDGNNEIYVMNADGSAQTRLTTNGASDSSPSWSPDGTRIAFSSDRDGNVEIYTMNADGANQARLTNNPANDSSPYWGVIPTAAY